MKSSLKRISALFLCLLMILASASFAFAASPTDEILNYAIVADVNDDGTVNLQYHIDWKVLVSDGIGPLEDVKIGIPNKMYVDYYGLTDTVGSISYDSEYGNSLMHIYLDKPYYAGETVTLEFVVVQDYMYEMNAVADGETLYWFVPGWFDEIAVDNLMVAWNIDKALSWSGGAYTVDGYAVWSTSLKAGEKYEIKVSYPNDAFLFDETKSYNNIGGDGDYNYPGFSFGDLIYGIFGLVGFFLFFIMPFIAVAKVIKKAYEKSSGFASGDTKTKVTRTKIEYYPNCPGCGAVRKEGQTVCEYCGRSLVKSEEVIKEEEIKDEDKAALKYKKNGEYHYGSDPNTYVRVNVVHVPVSSPSSRSSSSHSSSSRSSSGSSHSSCAHSSCACACASCACACACACAGGGRAGCSTKDFYNTKLKLKQLEMKKKK